VFWTESESFNRSGRLNVCLQNLKAHGRSYPITALELENKVLMIVPAPTITPVAITA
jgi:hypothetical protein